MQTFTGAHTHALTDDQASNAGLAVTEPQLCHDDIADILNQASGRPVVHRHLMYEQMRDRPAAEMALEFAAMLAYMDRSIAEGARIVRPTPSSASPAAHRTTSGRSPR